MANDKNEKWLDPEQLRFYRLKNGAHKLKNRSSKSILRIQHCNKINVYKTMSNAALSNAAKNGSFEARVELDRRHRKNNKQNPTP